MKVNPTIPMGGGLFTPTATRVRPDMHWDPSGPYGPLLTSDKAMIEAATGTTFNWPPKEGEIAPQVAFDLAMMRVRQMAEGSVLEELKASELGRLRATGVIDGNFAAKALEYLIKGGKDGALVESTDLHRGAAPISGSVGSDGSIYM